MDVKFLRSIMLGIKDQSFIRKEISKRMIPIELKQDGQNGEVQLGCYVIIIYL